MMSRNKLAVMAFLVSCTLWLALPGQGLDLRSGVRTLQRARVLAPGTGVMRARVLRPATPAPSAAPSAAAPATTATRATSPLSFTLSGFTSTQATQINTWLARAYPLLVATYGAPAPSQAGKTVRVVYAPLAGDGTYQPPTGGDGGIISFAADLAAEANNYNLTRLMALAFHGREVFDYDAWELGFADAAALLTCYAAAGSPRTFDPSRLGVYLLPVYDLFNRPELGNPIFFAGNTSPNLGFYRAGMAQAAWLKVSVENPAFFRSFNARYYARLATPGVTHPRGDIAWLTAHAAALAPQVEGLYFADWYRRQHVLDVQVRAGEKLWCALLPFPRHTSGDTRSTCFVILQRYITRANGSEVPVSGAANILALDENGVNITARSRELLNLKSVPFNGLGEGEIEEAGFTGTGTPEQARITLVFTAGLSQAMSIFPYGVAGTESRPSPAYGVSTATRRGTISGQFNGGTVWRAAVVRGAFASPSTLLYPSGRSVRLLLNLQPSDGTGPQVVRRNGAWAFYEGVPQSMAVVLENPTAATLMSVRWPGNPLLWSFISLPLQPVESDEARALGLPSASLQLAHYQPSVNPAIPTSGLPFGPARTLHEFYPYGRSPLMPGRGYWLRLPATGQTVSLRGGEPPRTAAYEVPLQGGWNQIGVPFNLAFALDAVLVRRGIESPVSLQVALARGWLMPGVWGWRPGGGYYRVDTATAATRRLAPWQAYYFYSRLPRGLKLVFDPRRTAATFTAPPSALRWYLPLQLSAQGFSDSDNGLGMLTTATPGGANLPAPEPPPGPRIPTLYFTRAGLPGADATGAGAPGGWSQSLAAPFTTAANWPFTVDGIATGQTATLSWGNTATLPTNLRLSLVDLQAGRRIAVFPATSSSYSFTATSTPRVFRMDASWAPVSTLSASVLAGSRLVRLRVENLATVATRDAAMNFLSIVSPEGQELTRIPLQTSGSLTVEWRGVTADGVAVPPGTYRALLWTHDINEPEAVTTFTWPG